MRIRYVLPVAVVVGLGIASLAIASTRDHGKSNGNTFTAFLNGHNETPANHTTGTGKLTLTIDSTSQMSYTLTYSGLSGGNTLFAHVHFAQPNVAGGVVFFLCGGGNKLACPNGSGTVSGQIVPGDILSPTNPYQGISTGDFTDVVQEIRAGFAYANVHTTSFPQGEIRGQLSSHGNDQGDDDQDDD